MVPFRAFTTALTLRPRTGGNALKFHIDMRHIPSNVGHSTTRGMRQYNEDRMAIGLLDVPYNAKDAGMLGKPHPSTQCPPPDRLMFGFGVYDGHGGGECGDYVSERLFGAVEGAALGTGTLDDLAQFWITNVGGYWKRWARRLDRVLGRECLGEIPLSAGKPSDVNKALLELIRANKLSQWELVRLKVWLAHLSTDRSFVEWVNAKNAEGGPTKIRSGTTATSAFLYPLEWPSSSVNGHFYEDGVVSRMLIAHVGDTHAILCDRDGIAHPLTGDHHPSNPVEARRLRKYGRGLIMTDSFGEERYLNFANTRAFGDLSGKSQGVSAEPEFTDLVLGSSAALCDYLDKDMQASLARRNVKTFGGDEGFLVLVSDGITNHLSDQEVVDLVTSTYNNLGVTRGTPQRAAEEITGFVECINGDDNATCIVVRLSGWGRWPQIDRTGALREGKLGSKLY